MPVALKRVEDTGDTTLLAHISLDEFRVAKERIKENTAAAPTDRIRPEMVRDMGEQEDSALLAIFNEIIGGKPIPPQWKLSTLFTLFKGDGSRNEPDNFRGIALLPVQLKLFTNIVYHRLLTHTERKGILSEQQNGFRPGRSVFEHIRILTNVIEDAKVNKKEIHASFIDFKKAFDSVEHWLVKRSMEFYGLPANFITLIGEIMSDNRTSVLTHYGVTDAIALERGVRQGDVLSPFLFLFAINPIIEHLERIGDPYEIGAPGQQPRSISGLSFADDVLLLKKQRVHLQQCLDELARIGKETGLVVNASKSAYAYRSDTLQEPLYFDGLPLPNLHSSGFYKYLGARINFDLSESRAREECIRKFTSVMRLISRRRWIDRGDRVSLINMIAGGILRFYANFTTFTSSNLKEMDNLMKRALYPKRTPNNMWVHLSQTDGGLGLLNPEQVCDRTLGSAFIHYGLRSHLSLARISTELILARQLSSQPAPYPTRILHLLPPSGNAIMLLRNCGVLISEDGRTRGSILTRRGCTPTRQDASVTAGSGLPTRHVDCGSALHSGGLQERNRLGTAYASWPSRTRGFSSLEGQDSLRY
jgi:hypothetical protein